MPQSAVDNPLATAMLGLLVTGDSHPYALLNKLRSRHPFMAIKTGSFYSLVSTLTRRGLLTCLVTNDECERNQLHLSPAGLAHLTVKVEQHILDSGNAADQRFLVALDNLRTLDPLRAADLLELRAARLLADRRHLMSAGVAGGSAVETAEHAFLTARLAHDAAWLTRLVLRLRSDTSETPSHSRR